MRILFAGNTACLSGQWLKQSFPDAQLTVVGAHGAAQDYGRAHLIQSTRRSDPGLYRELMDTYQVDYAVWFMQNLVYGRRDSAELSELDSLLEAIRTARDTRLVLIRAASQEEDDLYVSLQETVVSMCSQALSHDRFCVLNCPCLYRVDGQDELLQPLFESLESKHCAALEGAPDDHVAFMSMDDLGALLQLLLDEWPGDEGLSTHITVPPASDMTLRQLGNSLAQLKREWKISYTCSDTRIPRGIQGDAMLRERYGWFPRYRLTEDVAVYYRNMQHHFREREGVLLRLRDWYRKLPGAVRGLMELGLAAVLMEVCARLSAGQVQFSMVDFRLLFVVLMGTMYGLRGGLAAAVIASVMLYFAYQAEGRNAMILFYEPTNWIAFIGYLVTGAVCGYVKLKSRQRVEQVERENAVLADKLLFVRHLYEESRKEKHAYKKQILSTKDSFGKIFSITQQLSTVESSEIFIQAIHVLEQILENRSIAIYTVGRTRRFARLVASSGSVRPLISASLDLSLYPEAVSVLGAGGIFANNAMLVDYPAYMMGAPRSADYRVLIVIHRAEYGQMSLYYFNLFRIIGHLIDTALMNALQYEQMTRRERYVNDTAVMQPDVFLRQVRAKQAAISERLQQGMLLRLECGGDSAAQVDEKVSRCIRETDCIGMDVRGRYYLLLAQVSEQDVGIVCRRVEDKCGYRCAVVAMDDMLDEAEQSQA